MKRFALILIATAALMVALSSYAGAFTMSEKVVVANQLIAIARVSAGGMTADQRINRVNERLAYILGYEPLDAKNVYAVPSRGGTMSIMVGNRLLITVTSADAMANNTTVPVLTRYWLVRAREAMPQARPTPAIPG